MDDDERNEKSEVGILKEKEFVGLEEDGVSETSSTRPTDPRWNRVDFTMEDNDSERTR